MLACSSSLLRLSTHRILPRSLTRSVPVYHPLHAAPSVGILSLACLFAPFPPVRGLTTTALGNLYEAHCLASLQRLLPGLTLDQVGGAGDRGVDLRGWIHPDRLAQQTQQDRPDANGSADSGSLGSTAGATRVRVVVQCKATNRLKEKKLGPVILRELEGVMGRIARRSFNDDDDDGGEAGLESAELQDPREEEEQQQQRDDSQPSASPLVISNSTAQSYTGLLAILCSSSGFSKQTMIQTTNQVEGNVMLIHLALPEEVSRRLALEGLSDALGEGESSQRDIVSSPSSTPPTPTPSSVVAGEAAQPLSILLSTGLRQNGNISARGKQADPLSGRFSVGTRRSLQEGGGETPFLLWDGKEINADFR